MRLAALGNGIASMTLRTYVAPVALRVSVARLALGVCVALAAAACSRATALPSAALEAPRRLAETGLYVDFATRTLAPDVLAFVPQYPLWTDGARKSRWIRLPAGAAIDASDPDEWEFPVGTRLWKEFAFERRVETRMLERTPDGWRFAAYAWSRDESDAVLAPDAGLRGLCESAPGVRYDVPSQADCRACHLGAGGAAVLGFTALQLSDDRDPLAPHAEEPRADAVGLGALLERGLVRGLPERFRDEPPRIRATTPRGRAALGYLAANCGSCHAGGGPLAGLGLRLDLPLADAVHGAPPALATGVGVAGRYRLPGATADGVRIAPGAPERSTLALRLASRDPLVQMPPLGTHAVDSDALALVEAWIREDLAAGGPIHPNLLSTNASH